ncbi:MAG TPA: ATP-binding cassette domain-containing protein [Acidimicrobiales bacterium]|jgi:simple sugar transport system ATP-binding protein
MSPGDTPLLEARNVTKVYGNVNALAGVNFTLSGGEIVGLVGDNGAGKSTLVKTLCGAHSPSSGQILIDGAEVVFTSPKESREQGIEVVYQDLALANELSVTENIFLGREIRRGGFLGRLMTMDRKAMHDSARETLESLAIEIKDVETRCGMMSGGQRQAVAVARAIMWGSRILLLDEPTAALAVAESDKIAGLVSGVKEKGVGVILVSHNLPQVYELCDRVVVLLRGRVVTELHRGQYSIEDLVSWITGAAMHKTS